MEDDDHTADAPKSLAPSKPVKPSVKTAKGVNKSKPYRRPPSLGKTLTALRNRVIDTALQLQFQQSLFAELEAVEMDRATMPQRAKRTKSA